MITKDEIPKTILGIWGHNILSQGWTTIPNLLLSKQHELALTSSELVLLLHLISFMHTPNAKVFPSIETLSKRMNQDRRTTQRIMKSLELKEIIRKKIRSNSKRDLGLTNVYDLDPLMLKLLKLRSPTKQIDLE